MKKSFVIPIICIILVLVIALAGCKKKNNDIVEPGKDSIQSKDDSGKDEVDVKEVMKEFDKLIKNADEPNEIVKFIDEHIKGLSQIEGDKMIIDLENILESSISSETEILAGILLLISLIFFVHLSMQSESGYSVTYLSFNPFLGSFNFTNEPLT